MGLFGDNKNKETKEEKKERKIREMMSKYDLDNLSSEYYSNVRNIYYGLMGTGMMEFGASLSGMKSEDSLKISYLNALIEQNWIIIKQLDSISKKLDD